MRKEDVKHGLVEVLVDVVITAGVTLAIGILLFDGVGQ